LRFLIGFGYSIPVSETRSITATIITRDEQAHIAGAIASLACCDEVLVVDSGSTDTTRQIAERCGARVLVREWDGYSNQKNYAAGQARHDWILSLDADERLSIELANEIKMWKLSGDRGAAAASMPRRAFYFGAWIRHSGWYPDRKVRLYDRRRARWVGNFVHETLDVEGSTISFRGDIFHFPYQDWPDHLRRIDRYTRLAADAALASGKKGNYLRLILGLPLSFLRTFVLRAGFLDGWRGAVIAAAGARYVFMRELRILRGR
jgi:glycosyltransferase involved in cell wall biosynthesis